MPTNNSIYKNGINVYVTKIDNLEFFQGDTVTIPFEFVDGDGNPIDLRYVDVYWYLCPYGQYRSPALVMNDKTMDNVGNPQIEIDDIQHNICYVHLSYLDTRKLDYIKYSHQPVLILKNSLGTRRYIRAEGDIIFKPYIRDLQST